MVSEKEEIWHDTVSIDIKYLLRAMKQGCLYTSVCKYYYKQNINHTKNEINWIILVNKGYVYQRMVKIHKCRVIEQVQVR